MRTLSIILSILIAGCSSGFKTQFSRQPDRTLSQAIMNIEDVKFYVKDLDVDSDGIPDLRVWYLFEGAEYNEQTEQTTIHTSQHPYIMEKLKDGWLSYYREVFRDMDGVCTSAYELKGAEWVLVWEKPHE